MAYARFRDGICIVWFMEAPFYVCWSEMSILLCELAYIRTRQ